MVRQEFTFRGKTVEELQKLSFAELAQLLPSNERRKINRLTSEEKKFIAKAQSSKKPVKTHLRSMLILPFMVNKTIMIYDGHTYQAVIILPEMIGHRLGEYALTRKKVMHNAPGIGATKSSASLSVK
ncbi:30S ribosomal protein S19 [Candidatus Woesearchaeota archaeon]|nr:30S ribosomal protein S19 [Candidatus Woesearchaeota archaeon]